MPSSLEQQTADCVESLYNSLTDRALLSGAIEKIRVLLGAGGASYFTVLRSGTPLSFTAANIDPDSVGRWVDHFSTIDPHRETALASKPGQWAIDDTLLHPDRSPQPEYVHDFASKIGIRWFTGGKVMDNEVGHAFLTVHRPVQSLDFDNQTHALLDQLFPHVQRVSRLMFDMERSFAALQAAEAGVAQLGIAVGVVDAGGAVAYANPAMTKLVGRSPHVEIRGGRLEFAASDANSRLQQAVSLACRRPVRASSFVIGPDFAARLMVRVVPVPDSHPLVTMTSAARAVVFIGTAPTELGAQHLQLAFGLTSAEAELLKLLATGMSPDECARTRGVRIATVRSQLSSIFHKAGVTSQAQLLSLVLALPPTG